MNQLLHVTSSNLPAAPRNFSANQLRLVRHTVAKGTNDAEFDLFMELCRRVGLDPFRKQIHCVIYNADDADKRQMVCITSIDGFRAVAARNGNYRPDEDEPEITTDEALKDAKRNPLGIEKAVVRVWKMDSKGEWHKLTGVAYWEEFAPLKEVWEYSEAAGKRVPTGEFFLDPKNSFWTRMPKLMLAKCAEAQALRRGWPEDLSGVYGSEEMDGQNASALVQEAERQRREALLGGPRHVFQFSYGGELEGIPEGKVADRVLEWLATASREEVDWFSSANREGLKSFWGRCASDALEIKKAIEAKMQETEQ